MNKRDIVTPDHISRAVSEILRVKSDYRLLLGLYEKIFIEQERSKNSIDLGEFRMPEEVRSIQRGERSPLLDISQFVVDVEAATVLFGRICDILLEGEDDLAQSARRMRGVLEGEAASPGMLFDALRAGDDEFIAATAEKLGVSGALLKFVIYNSAKPSLVLVAAMMSERLDGETEWERGCCPLCGSMPELSVFEENGKRYLVCGFCGYKWQSKRVYCAFCENTDHETLRYYSIDDEEECRVEVCDKCKRYIKTIDTKKMSRPLYLPLESVATPYIDLKFKEMGYIPGNASVVQ